MKQLLILFIAAFSFISCSADYDFTGKKDNLEYKFKVGEQINVSHYIIQVSSDAKTFREAGTIFADNNIIDYYILVNASPEFNQSKTVYSRIECVDKDGNISYSKITQTVKP